MLEDAPDIYYARLHGYVRAGMGYSISLPYAELYWQGATLLASCSTGKTKGPLVVVSPWALLPVFGLATFRVDACALSPEVRKVSIATQLRTLLL